MSRTRGETLIDRLYNLIHAAADFAAIDAYSLNETRAQQTEAAVKAAIEAAVGNRLINILPESEWPDMIYMGKPYPFPMEET